MLLSFLVILLMEDRELKTKNVFFQERKGLALGCPKSVLLFPQPHNYSWGCPFGFYSL